MKQFNDNLLRRAGGWHIILIIAVSQIIGLLGAIPGFVSLQLIADFGEDLNHLFSSLLPILVMSSQIILLSIGWLSTPTAREQLTLWSKGSAGSDMESEMAGWKEITNLTTGYGISAFIVNALVIVIPPFIISQSRGEIISSVFQPTTISSPFPFYILLAGLASILGYIILTLMLIERFTLPARLILLPKDFDAQINGRAGALLGTKFQTLILGLIVIGVSIITPIGYQQAIRILYEEVSSFQIFGDLQSQSLLLSGLALFLGVSFTLIATRSIAGPVKELINTFQKIEAGDLNQRVPVTGTDELATVAIHFNRMVSRLDRLQSTLEEQVAERTKQLTATNAVGRVASSILDPEELMDKVVNLITERFDYYYAAIYLLDTSEKWADLQEATGQAGKVLKQNRHRLEISGKSMVAGSIREKMPRLAQNTIEEKQRFENPLLPYTRSEIALPLIIGDRVLGALNVQSTKPSDFDSDVVDTMENMASQVAVALENARLYQEARQSIKELRAIQKQYLLEGWTSIKSYNEELEYGVGEESEVANQILESPIKLRDQKLGQITLEHSDEWSSDQQSLVNAVTAQAAIALENARLVSESRQVALRERTLAEINSKIWSSPSIDAILQTVVKELGKRLDTSNTSIELNIDEIT
ncbi:MAG TPA: GAF domain-containing protein [Anaerolineales bacterium]|nr:GAF domain-containing protein [Anaerolineales bacterium]